MNTDSQRGIFLGLGSNLGDRGQALQSAVQHIAILPETAVLRCSSVFETEPWGEMEQNAFYNAVVEIHTVLDPQALLAAVKGIERKMGRIESKKYGPRLIDIDILLYGSTVLDLKHIAIPHPMLPRRQFVLKPLRELAAEMIHPVEQATIADLDNACTDDSKILRKVPGLCLMCSEAT